ncbi:nicotinamide riboside transporter PnuC [Brochothrix thermosphacta]|uniref:nicotinamide riboside transporter PnuC n=1 Tax=Brochothrix thermosphacta TaxID=2756 RepID=UPI00271427E1|nr:nicotinamide riboside transporter PnuC [Brochothrix thermosphacta]MDO7864817.1 nicotinamide riboside transporter PnuC [Brochothrix thermosphacta]
MMKSWLLVMLITQSVVCYVLGGTVASVFASLVGVVYVFLVTVGSKYNYILGIVNAGMVFYFAALTPVYGDMLLQGVMVILNAVGLGIWITQSLKGNHKTTVKQLEAFSDIEWKCIFVSFVLLLGVVYVVLGEIGSVRPAIDALTFTLGMTAMYSLIRGYKYQFMFWIMSNVIQVSLWISVLNYSEHAMALGSMYIMYLLNSFVGLIVWAKKK